MRLSDIIVGDAKFRIYRDIEYNKIHVSDMFNHRLGDKIAQSKLVQHRRQNIPDNEAIICFSCKCCSDYLNNNTYIDMNNYFSHIYDMIITLEHIDQRKLFGEKLNTIPFDLVAGEIWENNPRLHRLGIYSVMHSWPEKDLWWVKEKELLNIPDNYIAVHIITNHDYHPPKLMDFDLMFQLVSKISKYIPVVIIGLPENRFIPGSNIYDLTKLNYNIDESLAIINGCKMFLGGDTGVTHAAGAFGKFVVELYPGENRFHTRMYDAVISVPDGMVERHFLTKDHKFDLDAVLNSVINHV
jgi:hypothetical protein